MMLGQDWLFTMRTNLKLVFGTKKSQKKAINSAQRELNLAYHFAG